MSELCRLRKAGCDKTQPFLSSEKTTVCDRLSFPEADTGESAAYWRFAPQAVNSDQFNLAAAANVGCVGCDRSIFTVERRSAKGRPRWIGVNFRAAGFVHKVDLFPLIAPFRITPVPGSFAFGGAPASVYGSAALVRAGYGKVGGSLGQFR